MFKRKIAPWPDFKGQVVMESDVIQHPTGEYGTVLYDESAGDRDEDCWLVNYADGSPPSRYCLQVGDKGQAVLQDENVKAPLLFWWCVAVYVGSPEGNRIVTGFGTTESDVMSEKDIVYMIKALGVPETAAIINLGRLGYMTWHDFVHSESAVLPERQNG